MKRVEFVGPMGAGKSSVYAECKSGFSAIDHPLRVVGAEQLKRELVFHELRGSSLVYEAIVRVLSVHPRLKLMLVDNRISRAAWAALDERSDELRDFLSHALNGGVGHGKSCAHWLMRIRLLIRDVATIALFQKCAGKDFVIHDESLLQRGVALALSHRGGVDYVRGYADVVPAPDGLVLVMADPELLKARVMDRGRTVERHINQLVGAYEYSDAVADVMISRGVNVLRLDGSQCCALNARIVSEWITSLK